MNERQGYPKMAGGDFWADIYRREGMEPPWLQNWKNGRVVPRGEGGSLDAWDQKRKPLQRPEGP